MQIKQIYTGCLSQGACFIESKGEVTIIDSLWEVSPYIKMAEHSGSVIKYVFETRFHADFVSGHLSLSQKTGASIVFGPGANPDYDCIIAKDGQLFQLRKLRIKVLHRPGHTMESSCFLLLDENGEEHAVFTGDTLFLSDVGRPDLAQKASDISQESLVAHLYDSLCNKIMPLPDTVIVYPGHCVGSACGKHMSKEMVGMIGDQKQSNYALRANMTQAEFIKEVTHGLLPPPAHFPANVRLNKEGYQEVGQGSTPLSPQALKILQMLPVPWF